MNKESLEKIQIASQEDMPSKLERLYSTVPNYEKIVIGVEHGRRDFEEDIKKFGLERPHISLVHSYEDVEAQAFILGIPADLNENEIAIKSYHTYMGHFVDDILDNPAMEPSVETMENECKDIKSCLDAKGIPGDLIRKMAQKTTNPDAVYKGMHRVIYGALIQQTKGEKQKQHLRELKKIGTLGVAHEVAQDIMSIRDVPYWTTVKTAQEIWFASDREFDMTRAELWNLVYAPALYYHDIAEEELHDEFNIPEKPSIEDMKQMIDIAKKHLLNYQDSRLSQRIKQLKFLITAFRKNLPQELVNKYEELVVFLESHQ